jgi:Flp pilus assembly secretin CpaC
MSIQVLPRRTKASAALWSLVAGLLMCPIAVFAGADDMVAVVVDQAKVIKLPEKVATIVVGNPLIADVTLQPGGMVVVTGKGYGSTNMIAMDRSGGVLANRSIQVEGPMDKMVTVYRGWSGNPTVARRFANGV